MPTIRDLADSAWPVDKDALFDRELRARVGRLSEVLAFYFRPGGPTSG